MAEPEQEEQSYSKMLEPDIDALGRHCEQPYCHQLDFLPLRCESCRKQFCLNHRTEDAHDCSQKGAWAKRKREQASNSTKPSSRPNILQQNVKQCADTSCHTLLDTRLEPPGTLCDTCRREYCLKHRHKWEHSCDKITPLGIGKAPGLGDALGKLRAWGAAKKAAVSSPSSKTDPASPKQTSIRKFTSSLGKSKSARAAATSLAELNDLKRASKGPSGVPDDKKIYLFAEAEAFHTSGEEDRPGVEAKIPRMKVFLNKEWVVGRALDETAKLLQVQNRNNQTEDEKDRLRVFLIEAGRLLEFNEKLGVSLKNGNTIVLLRGIGPAAA